MISLVSYHLPYSSITLLLLQPCTWPKPAPTNPPLSGLTAFIISALQLFFGTARAVFFQADFHNTNLIPKKVELCYSNFFDLLKIKVFPFFLGNVWGSWAASWAKWGYVNINIKSSLDNFGASETLQNALALADFWNLFYVSRISKIWTLVFFIRFGWNLLQGVTLGKEQQKICWRWQRLLFDQSNWPTKADQ